ncbi:MAG: class I SAM-dependent methyltransferase [Ignavibacteriales bacterium]|nr:MAG: class I SAM-dependent methyltransferase [Ignavibacteriales bacterium]
MKARESGMPEEKIWEQFFDTEKILTELNIDDDILKLVDLGFGYGTFTVPASKRIKGNIYAYDIEENLTTELLLKLKANNISNVLLFTKDFIKEGTGLQNEEADYVMLFNILHAEKADDILNETYRILRKNGKVGVIHWNYDSSTPRGPAMSIRPKPEELKNLLIKSGFSILKYNVNLPPYHYGILAEK